MRRVYLDHNAASPMTGPVRSVLASAMERLGGNASSPHAEGQSARHLLESAREDVAACAGARPSEVIFTSGGTESNNAALRGGGPRDPGAGGRRRIVTSAVEHPSVLAACRALEEEGAEVVRLPVDGCGLVDPDDLRRVLARGGAGIVSIMHANNESGVVQPVEEIGRVCREAGVPYHCDAVQSAGRIPLGPAAGAAAMISFASHKAGGPAGVGALIVKEGTAFAPLIAGGAQEAGRRAGTEPVPLAAAFAAALRLKTSDLADGSARMAALRDRLEGGLRAIEPRCRIHGEGAPRLPNTTNFFLPGSPGRLLVMQLDLAGYAVSTGSACSTGSARPSHVLAAMGCSPREALDSLRISIGPETTLEEILGFLEALAVAIGARPGAGAAATGGSR